jgi:hypothetical protein
MKRILNYLRRWLALFRGPIPPGSWRDPFAPKMAPRTRPPKGRSGAVAVAEPEE